MSPRAVQGCQSPQLGFKCRYVVSSPAFDRNSSLTGMGPAGRSTLGLPAAFQRADFAAIYDDLITAEKNSCRVRSR
jgi:hypothetical protein